MSDDIVSYNVENGRTVLSASGQHLRLWEDVLEQIGYSTASLDRAHPEGAPKFHVPLQPAAAHGPVPLKALLLLRYANPNMGERADVLQGAGRLLVISKCLYALPLANHFARSGSLADRAMSLPNVRVIKFRRTAGFEHMDHICEAIEQIAAEPWPGEKSAANGLRSASLDGR